MESQKKPRKLRKVILVISASLFGLIIIGVIFQLIGQALDNRRVVSGKQVNVGDTSLRLKCTGSGSPTILLEAASGNFSSSWGWVQPELSKQYRVCSYDRASLGFSKQIQDDFSLKHSTAALHEALKKENEKAPFVVVGHSMGALYTRAFQAAYPDEVSGIVLVDGSSPKQLHDVPSFIANAHSAAGFFDGLSAVSHIGLMRLGFLFGASFDFSTLPEVERNEMHTIWSSPKGLNKISAELKHTEAIYQEAQNLPQNLHELPLLVLSASDPVYDTWNELQKDLATLSRTSKQQTIKDSTHMSLVFDKKIAQRVNQAILDFLLK